MSGLITGHHHFLLFSQFFKGLILKGHENFGLCAKELIYVHFFLQINFSFLTLSQTANFRPKFKQFADINFKFDENGRKFSKWEENIVGKGETPCYEQFVLYPQCFQKTCSADT